jgi:hypothetical protein
MITHFPSLLKGTVARDFRPSVFFINQPHRFAYGFVFAEIIASKVIKICFSGVNDPAETENEV